MYAIMATCPYVILHSSEAPSSHHKSSHMHHIPARYHCYATTAQIAAATLRFALPSGHVQAATNGAMPMAAFLAPLPCALCLSWLSHSARLASLSASFRRLCQGPLCS